MFKYAKEQKSKLGKIINFSFLPVLTCVQDCKYCYAKKIVRIYKNSFKRFNENSIHILKTGNFPDLPKSKNKLVRFLVSGDFALKGNSTIGIYAFIDLVHRYPDYKFFGFTKTWTKKEFLKPLNVLNSYKNVNLFLSIDSQTGFNYPKNFNLAITSLEDINRFKGKRFFTCNHSKTKINCDTCLVCIPKRNNFNLLLPIH